MRKLLLLSFLLSLGFSPLTASKLSQDEAREIAEKFISSHFSTRSETNASQLSVTPYKETVYVVNNPSGGWVLVSADNTPSQQILGYSPNGHFSLENLPDGARWMLDEYVKGIVSFGANPGAAHSVTRTESSVAPLLGEIAWHQYAPFNAMCPEMNGEPTLAGCVNIAIAQIMAFHKYPQKGMGSHYYNWNDTKLSADFSKSTYRWDLMKPVYTGDETQSEKDAVAQLIYDLGVCNQSNFTPGETGAELRIGNFLSYFDYDPGISCVIREQCKAKDYEDILRSELNAGRPVYVEGGSPQGAHAFVCDGYDNEGYFHYNYGWGDASNGYYLCSATGFDSYPSLTIGIKPNEGGFPGLWAATGEDVYWEKDDYINCYFNGVIYSGQSAIIEAGLGLENKNTGKVIYYPKIKSETPESNIQIFGFTFDDKVEDGEYILYPICRVEGDQWKRVYVGENAADKVEVSVKNGIKTYTNSGVGGVLDPDVVFIDGIYYKFDGEEAIVTKRNNRGKSYKGDVIIPEVVSYEGKSYPITVIGDGAFTLSQLNTLTVGKNIRLIEAAAFTQCHVDNLLFAESSQLKEVASWAFNLADIPVVKLPEGLETLGACAFRGEIESLDLPSTLKYIPKETISCVPHIFQHLYLHWEKIEDFPENHPDAIITDVSQATLHVPAGCIDIYKNHDLWGKFGKIKDTTPDEIAFIDGIYYIIEGEEATVTSTKSRMDGYSGDIVLPESVEYNGKSYPVTAIGKKAFESTQINSLTVGKNIRLIGDEAFSQSIVDNFLFAKESQLKEIGFAAFNFSSIPTLILPEGLEKIGENAFVGDISVLDLPHTVKTLPAASLGFFNLKDLYVHWENADEMPFFHEYTITGDVSKSTLHVPEGCTAIYRNHELWKAFGNITDDTTGIHNITGDSDDIKIVVTDGTVSIESSEINVEASIYSMDGKFLTTFKPGMIVNLGKGIYILRIGKEVKKIII